MIPSYLDFIHYRHHIPCFHRWAIGRFVWEDNFGLQTWSQILQDFASYCYKKSKHLSNPQHLDSYPQICSLKLAKEYCQPTSEVDKNKSHN